MRISITELRGKIDFGIITMREDEHLAVYDRFKPEHITSQGSRTYDVGTINTSDGHHFKFVLIRTIAPGEGKAQDAARDMIEDLQPKWILLVGIGGAVPSADFTLGDVVCATRVNDFCVRAVKEGASDSFAAAGGPMHRIVEDVLARLPIIERRLKGWNSQKSIGMKMPTLVVPNEGSDRYYGSDTWQAEVRHWLGYHFESGNNLRQPHVTARPVASSDALIKNSSLLNQWLTEARDIAAIEMELAGIYIAARRPDKEYPILAIRGISDIVGFKREEVWTKYACNTAAAFALALIKSGQLTPPEPSVSKGRELGAANANDTSNPQASGGNHVHKMCDRSKQISQFDRFFKHNYQNRPRHPHIYIVHGKQDECHDSLIDRLSFEKIEPYAQAIIKNPLNGIVCSPKRLKWVNYGDNIITLQEELKIILFEAFGDAYDTDDLSATALCNLPQLKKYSFVIIQHDIKLDDQIDGTEKLTRWYLTDYWARIKVNDSCPQFMIFMNFIYPDSKLASLKRLFPFMRFNRERFRVTLEEISKTTNKFCPCLLFDELSPPKRDDVDTWLRDYGGYDSVYERATYTKLIYKRRWRISMSIVEEELRRVSNKRARIGV